MKKAQLEKLGIYSTNSRRHPREFLIPNVGEVIIGENWEMRDVYNLIYQKGQEDGMQIGKVYKANEIKKCLGIEIES